MKKIMLLIASALIILVGCEEEQDPHYQKPDWLKGPLFDQIESTGEFSSFVKAAEMSGYDEFLNPYANVHVFLELIIMIFKPEIFILVANTKIITEQRKRLYQYLGRP